MGIASFKFLEINEGNLANVPEDTALQLLFHEAVTLHFLIIANTDVYLWSIHGHCAHPSHKLE